MSTPRVLLSAAAACALVFPWTNASRAKSPPPTEPDPLRPSDARGEVPFERGNADYWIEARLDPESKTVVAGATLRWTNPTGRTVSVLPFHLYMNAFRAEDTAWMRSSGGSHRGITPGKELDWGYVDVWSMQRAVGDTLEDVPYAEDPADPTLMTVTLPEPVGPGRTVELRYTFETKLPRVFARTGYADDFFMVAQWFPKIGVLEEAGGWKAHVFTLNDEFYADFGDYEVTLDVPAEMVVGASGVRVSETTDGSRKRIVQRAKMVHDFAWTAYADFAEHEGTYEGIRIRQLLPEDRLDDAPAHLEAQILALRSFEDRYGPYPWSTITIVHPPKGAGGAGGMEYPTLYTTSNRLDLPAFVRRHLFDERVAGTFTTVHEFGHQYFQGLFASNEHEQAWVDEGLNTMADLLAYEDAYGRGTEDDWVVRVVGHRLPIDAFTRLSLGRRGGIPVSPIDRPASHFPAEVGDYAAVTYSKTAAAMLTLRRLVGDDAFRKAMAAYAARARFAHPTGDDLVHAFVETLGAHPPVESAGDGDTSPATVDLADFFDQMRHGTGFPDFRVRRVSLRRALGTAGYHRSEDGTLVETPLPEDFDEKVDDLPDDAIESVVVVTRPGEFRVPVEILVAFEDDTAETVWWDGRERSVVLTFAGKRVRYAAVDPAHRILLEPDRLDNTRYRRPGSHTDAVPAFLGALAEGIALLVTVGVAS
ncbi:MAG: M1 family peptidase [Deltaproteobacteria bacterium]|nr:MAG: M1 family peptidase [Deltaproteobacteria bacterium]